MNTELVNKYNVAAPRYTSYPTVPYWDHDKWSPNEWLISVKTSYQDSSSSGISLYIHLPFCESLCTYCGCTTRITKNHDVEGPYIEAVLKEWDLYCKLIDCKPRIREIHLGGGTPTFFTSTNLQKLITGITLRSEISDGAEFSFEAHPANTTHEHLKTLYDCGFRRISVGIQDFDPKVQEIINRKQSVDQVVQITKSARLLGYKSINFDLIYGLPLQKLSSVENTIHEVIKLMPDRIAFYSYAHVPWIKPGQRKFSEADLPDGPTKRALYERGKKLLLQAGYHDIGMDHFSLSTDILYKASTKGILHRNFMGYTHQYTQLSLALGVSAISDSWYAFAQNTKIVEDYLQRINKGEFPLIKGHLLTETDLNKRREILNLICRGYTELSNLNLKLIKRLIPLLEDKLLEFKAYQLWVTPLGKDFIRTICMAFDERLYAAEPTSQLFSKGI